MGSGDQESLARLADVRLELRVEVARTRMRLSELVSLLRPGTIIELDTSASTPVGLYTGRTLLGVGEIVAADELYGIRITQAVDRDG